MGIKFHCPNGHKLHVKSFLAGKKGVCPECGVRIVIPETSEPRTKRKRGDAGAAQPMVGAAYAPGSVPLPTSTPVNVTPAPIMAGVPVAVAPVAASAMPMGFPAPGSAVPNMASPVSAPGPYSAVPNVSAVPNFAGMPMQAPMSTAPHPQGHAVPVNPMVAPGAAPFQTGMPQTMASPVAFSPIGAARGPVAAAPIADPIAENPNATWYVRPPSGGQYGPARGDVMRKWIGEGRVSADSLVWREGWTDWLGASVVFPSLKGTGAQGSAPTAAPAESAAAAPFLTSSPVTTTSSTKKKSSSKRGPSATTAVAIVVMLALLAVGLLIALFYVLSQTQGTKKKSTTQRSVSVVRFDSQQPPVETAGRQSAHLQI